MYKNFQKCILNTNSLEFLLTEIENKNHLGLVSINTTLFNLKNKFDCVFGVIF